MIRRTLATVDWHQFDGRLGNLNHSLPYEPALVFKCPDGAVDTAAGIWTYCLVEFASKRYPTIAVNHLGFLGIIRDDDGVIIALTAVNPGDSHD